jgi:DDE family transposase
MEQGTSTRLIVTSTDSGPKELSEWYVRSGASENWIKDFKLALKADRLSCHRFIANQFRLLLHAAAYWLLDVLRKKLCELGVERLQLETLRLRLIKIGGRVRELFARIKLHLASGHPGQPLWHMLATSVALS